VDLHKYSDDTKLELQVAPLIDVVFLLLIYFMVTAALIKKEGDITFMLPVQNPENQIVDIPVEALIHVTADGGVELDAIRYSKGDRDLLNLSQQLSGLRAIAKSQHSPFFVTIVPNRDVEHQRIIDVMDACAAAGVKNLSFSQAL